ncbi:MAG: PQQ-binding-like beta-propeller repeat protein [Actinomycetota bacterium]
MAPVEPDGVPALPCSVPARPTGTSCRAWTSTYDHGSWDRSVGLGAGAHNVAVSPDGHFVFTTFASFDDTTGYDTVVVAFDAVTGQQVWSNRFDWNHLCDTPLDIAVSPDGSRVFVIGVYGSPGALLSCTPYYWSYATLAFDAATGIRLWFSSYIGPEKGPDMGFRIAVSPAGDTVFVSGVSCCSWVEGLATWDLATVAYDAATGERRWVARYDDPEHGDDEPLAIAVSPDGSRVFVSGAGGKDVIPCGLCKQHEKLRFQTVAYDAHTGQQQWVRTYDGVDGTQSAAWDLVVAQDSTRVFVTGTGNYGANGSTATTLAYDAADGDTLWEQGEGSGTDGMVASGSSVVVSPTGLGRVYVGGTVSGTALSGQASSWTSFAAAYDPLTGERRWMTGQNAPSNFESSGTAITVAPDGSAVYEVGLLIPVNDMTAAGAGVPTITANLFRTTPTDWMIAGFSAATGAKLFEDDFNSSVAGIDEDLDVQMAVGPEGTVYAAGTFVSHGYGDPLPMVNQGVVKGSPQADFGLVAVRP